MLLDLTRWLFINTMVAVGLAFLSAHAPFLPHVRNTPAYRWRDALFYSAMAVFCVLFPWKGPSGIQLDMRAVVLLLAGWIDGLPVAIPVAIIEMVVRLIIGGPGALPSAVVVSYIVLLIYLVRKQPRSMGLLAAAGFSEVFVLFLAMNLLLKEPPSWSGSAVVWAQVVIMHVTSLWLLNSAFDHTKEMERLRSQLASEVKTRAAVLELLPYGVIFLDLKGNVIGCNQAARTLTTGPIQEVLTHPDLAQARRERRRVGGLRLTATVGGVATQLLVATVPLEDGYALGIQNVTNVVAEERMEAQRDRLELLGQLAAMAAHEIKNPLTTIKGFLQLLERRPEFAGHRGTLGLMLGEAEHINRVVGDFLLLAGRQESEPACASLDAILQEVLQLAELQYPQGGVQVELHGPEGLSLTADSRAVRQILRNLIVNAYEAMPEGGRLIIERRALGDILQISVTDTGPGIAPEILPLIFRPYVTTKTTGTGLGLAISHKLALEMGGQLELTSEVGQGSTFVLTLPLP